MIIEFEGTAFIIVRTCLCHMDISFDRYNRLLLVAGRGSRWCASFARRRLDFWNWGYSSVRFSAWELRGSVPFEPNYVPFTTVTTYEYVQEALHTAYALSYSVGLRLEHAKNCSTIETSRLSTLVGHVPLGFRTSLGLLLKTLNHKCATTTTPPASVIQNLKLCHSLYRLTVWLLHSGSWRLYENHTNSELLYCAMLRKIQARRKGTYGIWNPFPLYLHMFSASQSHLHRILQPKHPHQISAASTIVRALSQPRPRVDYGGSASGETNFLSQHMIRCFGTHTGRSWSCKVVVTQTDNWLQHARRCRRKDK